MSRKIIVLTGEKVSDTRELVSALLFDVLGVERSDGNNETPFRVMKMLLDELLTSVHINKENELSEMTNRRLTTCFPTDSKANVVVEDIAFYSLCEHHLMPFFGKCRVEYKPNGKVIGLSKIPKIVEFYSKKPQLQETLTEDIHRAIGLITGSEYVKVELYAVTHLCVEMRGVKNPCKTTTVLESERCE